VSTGRGEVQRALGEAPTGTATPAGRFSRCWAHRDLIASMLERALSAVHIHADLRDEHGVELSYHSVRRFVASLSRASPEPFRRMECGPGEEVQVDFGTGPMVMLEGPRAVPGRTSRNPRDSRSNARQLLRCGRVLASPMQRGDDRRWTARRCWAGRDLALSHGHGRWPVKARDCNP
jgi:hypothetical protein